MAGASASEAITTRLPETGGETVSLDRVIFAEAGPCGRETGLSDSGYILAWRSLRKGLFTARDPEGASAVPFQDSFKLRHYARLFSKAPRV